LFSSLWLRLLGDFPAPLKVVMLRRTTVASMKK
jgi:hypothetical protein